MASEQVQHSEVHLDEASQAEIDMRSRIDAVQDRASFIVDETYDLRADTNVNLHRLYQLRKNRGDLERYYESLNNKITGLTKMQKKKKQEIRIHTKKIQTLEERIHNREAGQKEKELASKQLAKARSEKAIHKNGYISTELIRLKRKLDHEIIMDGIRSQRQRKFFQTKVEQVEQRDEIERRRYEIMEENRKKMLEVQFNMKVAKLSMQRYKEKSQRPPTTESNKKGGNKQGWPNLRNKRSNFSRKLQMNKKQLTTRARSKKNI